MESTSTLSLKEREKQLDIQEKELQLQKNKLELKQWKKSMSQLEVDPESYRMQQDVLLEKIQCLRCIMAEQVAGGNGLFGGGGDSLNPRPILNEDGLAIVANKMIELIRKL